MTKPAISNFDEKRLRILEILVKNKTFLSESDILNELDKYEIIPGEISVILNYLLIGDEIILKTINEQEAYIAK